MPKPNQSNVDPVHHDRTGGGVSLCRGGAGTLSVQAGRRCDEPGRSLAKQFSNSWSLDHFSLSHFRLVIFVFPLSKVNYRQKKRLLYFFCYPFVEVYSLLIWHQKLKQGGWARGVSIVCDLMSDFLLFLFIFSLVACILSSNTACLNNHTLRRKVLKCLFQFIKAAASQDRRKFALLCPICWKSENGSFTVNPINHPSPVYEHSLGTVSMIL